MTFTYLIANDIGKIRMEIGDTVSTRALFTDEEIQYKLDGRAGNILMAAADLCQVLAAKFAREVDFSMDGQSVSASQKSKRYGELEKELRAKAGGSVGTVVTTKIDGYSSTTETPPNATDRDRQGNRNDFEVGRYDF